MERSPVLRKLLVAAVLGMAVHAFAATPAGAAPPTDATDPRAIVAEAARGPVPSSFAGTGLTRADYLPLMAGDVDYFKQFQRTDGAIIDPVQHSEVQYSTPAFALAAAMLAVHAERHDLLEPATRATTCALDALAAHRAANGHSDFYIPLLVHTYDLLKEIAPAETVAHWRSQFQSIRPEKTYNMKLVGMNWNIVSSSGELLRRQDHLVADDQLEAQWRYLERCLKGHLHTVSPLGLFEDEAPKDPMAYDAFSRLWLEDMMAAGAYTGDSAGVIADALERGALSGLLLLSPSGEWISGGRSAFHNWNEAENIVIDEIAAGRAMHENRPEEAKMFKRGAHLAFESMQRWVRPTGELDILKNRAEPGERFAYETYSGHSQYNLLPMAMLAMAYAHADDTIGERPIPAECASYVFDLRAPFHKIAAASNGYFACIDTHADGHYNATGLQRVHRAGVAFPALSDSVAPERGYQPKPDDKTPAEALAPGLAWQMPDGAWLSLAAFTQESAHPVEGVTLAVESTSAEGTDFTTEYTLKTSSAGTLHLREHYTLGSKGLTCTATLTGDDLPRQFRAEFPMLLDDGKSPLPHTLSAESLAIENHGSVTTFTLAPHQSSGRLSPVGLVLMNHNGHVQRVTAPVNGPTLTYVVTLENK